MTSPCRRPGRRSVDRVGVEAARTQDGSAAEVDPPNDRPSGRRREDLLASQMCGCPYRAWLASRVALVGRSLSEAAAEGRPFRRDRQARRRTAAGVLDRRFHRGQWLRFVDRLDQPGSRARRCRDSQSRSRYGHRRHARSAIEVGSGRCDLAAVDAVTLLLLRRFRPEIAQTVEAVASTV